MTQNHCCLGTLENHSMKDDQEVQYNTLIIAFACVHEKYSTQVGVLASRHASLWCIFHVHTQQCLHIQESTTRSESFS